MSTIGNVLKEARSKKSISLEEVHSRIKIHPRVLQLLEEDKFEKLPSPVFVKSFLKSYAEFLEVNPEEIIRRYEKEDQKEPAQILYIKPAAEREKKTIFAVDKSLLVLPAILLIVLFTGFFAVSLFKKAAHHLKEKKVAVVSKSSKTAKVEAVKPAQENTFDSENWLRHTQLGNFPKIGKKDALKLKIKAADNVWLRVTCDGKVLFQSILKQGVTEAWTAKDHFEIWTGNASNMELSLNNYDLGSPGKGVTNDRWKGSVFKNKWGGCFKDRRSIERVWCKCR